ncbi:MAG TPA: hypothetical protein VHF05_03165 [Candidatus Paceibacterota bacterium]|jgi:hypothetical protein|nr:hypothetical protein [Candidatus Paceibacterota bacterium]
MNPAQRIEGNFPFAFSRILPALGRHAKILLMALAIFLFFCGTIFAGTTLTNETIAKMANDGVPVDAIVATINSAPQANFDTSFSALGSLATNQHVPDAVLKAMQAKMQAHTAAPEVSTPSVQSAESDHNGLNVTLIDAKGRQYQLNDETQTPEMRGGGGKMLAQYLIPGGIFIFKNKLDMTLPGDHSDIKVSNPTKITIAGLPSRARSHAGKAVKLVELEVHDGTRIVQTSSSLLPKIHAFRSKSAFDLKSSVEGKDVILTFDPLNPGHYALVGGPAAYAFDVVASPSTEPTQISSR